MIINIFLAIIAYRINALTFKGTIVAFVLGLIVYSVCKEAYIVLFCYFVFIIIVEKMILKRNREKRNCLQVLSNIGFALLSMVLFIVLEEHRYFVLYCGLLSVSMCDTLASTMGTRYAKNVYSITKLKKVEKGISGGVSLCGTVFGVMGSTVIAIVYSLIMLLRPAVPKTYNVLMIILLGALGMIIDSLLGDVFQKKYYCQKCKRISDSDEVCCDNATVPVGYHLLSNSQVNVMSEGIIFVLGLLLM